MANILPVPFPLSSDFLEEVRQCAEQDGILAVATESFYALAASVRSVSAVERVAEIKGRPADKPLLVLIGERRQMKSLVISLPPWADSFLNRFWPGPLTCIFHAKPGLPPPLLGEGETIGVRCPGNEVLRSILCTTGPLTGTSANRTGFPALSHPQEVLREFGGEIDLILDRGPSPGGRPSTLLSLVGRPRILREGPISSNSIQVELVKHGVTLFD
ncbi:L-threonylcarbamoyladenylate synthase [Candidatus Nitronereus thalassa]|uniref:L-threonylcarbamoyladenylate synthase n=1 Tax=Candidatus Nitronereus thalassa TaxID=3020898 RepID=A0ABU3K5M3_9BACT|nr:L-threonylcarbamoyladenylate synthase [Candidatus Nitronereus thalassa]MDT7041695.1 L-threonylcarbamoyladenylate synthase [Candidatus Nitronereus thalassa]